MVTEDEFAEWASNMLDRTIRPEGDAQKAAYRAGWRAGRLRLDVDSASAIVASLDAWSVVCFWTGHGDGVRMSETTRAQLNALEGRASDFLAAMSKSRGRAPSPDCD